MSDQPTEDSPEEDTEQDAGHDTGELDRSEIEEIERERAERLDPDNRPDGVEIDNTDREFDAEKGMFTDSEGYDEAPSRFPPPGEQGV